MKRRSFIQAGSAVAATAATTLAPSAHGAEGQAKPAPPLKKGDVILFQGDSITDARRNRKTASEPNSGSALGNGYPSIIAGGLLTDHRDLKLKIYNRGISGNKVPNLAQRWQKDSIDLKPAILSILVGVNDIWHKLNNKYDGTPEVYRDGLAALLQHTKEELTDTTLVICEPFVLRCGAVTDKWFPEFNERKTIAKEVATEAGALWVPFQDMFDDAVSAGTAPNFWAGDGVHPSVAGHALMARTWRKTVGI